MISVWDEVVEAALMGTDRRPFSSINLPGAAGDLLRTAPGLLDAATVVWAHGEVGRRLVPHERTLRDGQVDDDRPLLSVGAVRALEVIVGDRRFLPALDEWLELAVRAGGRPPGEAVPALLDAVRDPQRPACCRVVGPLAAWLGARNPTWQWATRVRPQWPDSAQPHDAMVATTRQGDEVAMAALETAPSETLQALVGSRSGPWSAALTEAALDALARCIRAQRSGLMALRTTLPALAHVVDPEKADEVSALVEVVDGLPDKERAAARAYWAASLASLAAMVHFRRSLHKEFS